MVSSESIIGCKLLNKWVNSTCKSTVDSQPAPVVDFRPGLAVGVQPGQVAVFQRDPVVDAQPDLVTTLIPGIALILIVKKPGVSTRPEGSGGFGLIRIQLIRMSGVRVKSKFLH